MKFLSESFFKATDEIIIKKNKKFDSVNKKKSLKWRKKANGNRFNLIKPSF